MVEKPQTLKKGTSRETVAHWKALVAKYQQSCPWRATWQIINTVGAYVLAWTAMYFLKDISWWLTIPVAILSGGLLIRVFIIFHDCGHGSFFSSRTANDIWGFITGVLSFTPYHHWRWEHNVHHATNGDLDRRGTGDIWTLTVTEYLESSRLKKFAYRLARNPIVLFVIAPLYLFVVHHRFSLPKAKPREVASVWICNAVIVLMSAGLISLFGFWPWLTIQVIAIAVAGTGGVWLFYVQHQFEDVYWERGEDWDFTEAAIQGSSFYKLPKVLQWFSGNIGFHHIHHLSPRIPNYNLERCHRSDPMFSEVKPLTLLTSLKSINFRLWDEETRKLISFAQFKRILRTRTQARA